MELPVIEIAHRTVTEGGATFDIRTKNFVVPIDAWYYPHYPKITTIIPVPEQPAALSVFLSNNKNLLQEKDNYLGTWLNPKTQEVYLDITICKNNLDKALTDAREISIEQGRKIVTIYNPYLKKTEYVWDDVTA